MKLKLMLDIDGHYKELEEVDVEEYVEELWELNLKQLKKQVIEELEMGRIRELLGATEDELLDLKQRISGYHESNGFEVQHVNKIIEYMAYSGFRLSEIRESLPWIIELVKTDELDIDSLLEIVPLVMNLFGIKLKTVVNVFKDELSGVNIDIGKIKDIGPIMSSLGVSFRDTIIIIKRMEE